MLMWAQEIRFRAQRRVGELLKETAKTGGRHKGGGDETNQYRKEHVSSHDDASKPTLKELGLTRDESSDYQKLAAMPQQEFEKAGDRQSADARLDRAGTEAELLRTQCTESTGSSPDYKF